MTDRFTPVADARAHILAACSQVAGTQRVPVRDALGRVLAVDVISPVSVPPHDNSAMDGYAVRHADLSADADTRLTVVGTAYAGRHGIGGWLPDYHFALKHERAGDNPLVIRAVGVQGSYQANAVVSDADAALIIEANQGSRDHFLENCKVIFVLESPRRQRDMREAETAGKL